MKKSFITLGPDYAKETGTCEHMRNEILSAVNLCNLLRFCNFHKHHFWISNNLQSNLCVLNI